MGSEKLTVQDKLTETVELILRGVPEPDAVAEVRDRFGMKLGEARKLVDRAYTELEELGQQDRARMFGLAVGRLERLWGSCLNIQDYKTALQVLRELNRLHGL